MDIEAGLRRIPPPDLADVGEDTVLVERLRATIERDGPVTFARFMETALYDPERGYYRAEPERPIRSGDFLTAPETHPVFGHTLSRQLEEVWQRLDRPDPFVLREDGAGSGTLGLSVLAGLAADGSELVEALRYAPVEGNRHRLAELEERFGAAGLADRLAEPGTATRPFTGAVIANELLDALPVHRVTVHDGALAELYVDWDGACFVDAIGPPSTPALADRLTDEGVILAEGQRGEVCLAIDGWVAEVGVALARGLALVIDYGYPADRLYAPSRRDGTLLAYVRHTAHDDPYRHVGRQDLTAHVDLTAVERAARVAGLDVLGRTTQAELLAGLGLGDLLTAAATAPDAELGPYLELRSAVVRMLDPRAMGGFAAVFLGRGLPALPVLRGLAFRLVRPGEPGPG